MKLNKNRTMDSFKDLATYVDDYVNGGVSIIREYKGDEKTEYLVLKVGQDFNGYEFPFTIRKSTRGKICYFYEDSFYLTEKELVMEIYNDLKSFKVFRRKLWR